MATTLDETTLNNADRDADDLGKFMNDAAGTFETRTGGPCRNLRQVIADVEAAMLGDEVVKETAGGYVVTDERILWIKKTVAAATAVTIPDPADRNRVPLTIGNLGGTVDYIANPTTLTAPVGKNFTRNGSNVYVMDGAEQVITLKPLPDDSGYVIVAGLA